MTSGLESVHNALTWRWRHFALFSGPEWHKVLDLRTAIFVVEQKCPYQEVDDKDTNSWHLEVIDQSKLIGTLRVLPQLLIMLNRLSRRARGYRHIGLGRELSKWRWHL